MVITHLWRALRTAWSDSSRAEERLFARRELARLLSGSQPHTGCARAFVELF